MHIYSYLAETKWNIHRALQEKVLSIKAACVGFINAGNKQTLC